MKKSDYTNYFQRAVARLVEPRKIGPAERKQQYLLSVLFVGLQTAAIIALLDCGVDFLAKAETHYRSTFMLMLLFNVVVAGLTYASRQGHYKLADSIFIVVLILVAARLTVQSGFMLPQVQLLYALIIIVVGLLISARVGFIVIGIVMTLIVAVGYLEVYALLNSDTQWLAQTFSYGQPTGYVIVLMVIGLVSWLSGSEIDRSWRRARRSEKVLTNERASLEATVSERTRQLKEAQFLRSMELQRFAEFGRLNANLIHDLANPLTAASINLAMLDPTHDAELLLRVRQNLKHVKRYVDAARLQVRGQSVIHPFSVRGELGRAVLSLQPRAEQAGVKLRLQPGQNFKLTGDAIKFNQLMANLIANGIDAYSGAEASAGVGEKQVEIAVAQTEAGLRCSVIDHGVGILPGAIAKIFDPFYSTKSEFLQSMGIGLAMVKQFVEHDFMGTITVKSSPTTGTCFSVELSSAEPHDVDLTAVSQLLTPDQQNPVYHEKLVV